MTLDHLSTDELVLQYLALVEELVSMAPGAYDLDTDQRLVAELTATSNEACSSGVCSTAWHPRG